MIIFWVILLVIFLIIEAMSFDLTAIWFAIGSLAAFVLALFGVVFWIEVAVFAIVSGLTLYFTRPIAKRYIMPKRHATNADRVIGTTCVVLEAIDNVNATGTVQADGKLWTARSLSGEIIAKDALVLVESIEGIKLMVSLVQQNAHTEQ